MSCGKKIEKDSGGKVIEICEIVNPNTELPVLLSIFSLDLESQAQIDFVEKKTQSNADENLSYLIKILSISTLH